MKKIIIIIYISFFYSLTYADESLIFYVEAALKITQS